MSSALHLILHSVDISILKMSACLGLKSSPMKGGTTRFTQTVGSPGSAGQLVSCCAICFSKCEIFSTFVGSEVKVLFYFLHQSCVSGNWCGVQWDDQHSARQQILLTENQSGIPKLKSQRCDGSPFLTSISLNASPSPWLFAILPSFSWILLSV